MKRSQLLKQILPASLLLIGMSVYPVLNSYAINATILRINNMWGVLFVMAAAALVIFFVTGIFIRKDPFQTALASTPFLLLFLNYGSIYNALFNWDKFQIFHYSLLPVLIVICVYLAWAISKINNDFHKKIWLVLISVVSFLVIFSLSNIIPAEYQKQQQAKANDQPNNLQLPVTSMKEYPDIYWLVFDEFAGFDAARDYFKYPQVDDFIRDLEASGFDVIEGSHSETLLTLREIAARLNYTTIDPDMDRLSLYGLISDNKVMRTFKEKGYTTVVLDEPRSFSFGFPGKTKIVSDINLDEMIGTAPTQVSSITGSFSYMVYKRTVLAPWIPQYELDDEEITRHQKAIYYVAHELGSLTAESPKFVYTHLMFPHEPIIFASDGSLLDLEQLQNWDNYLGQYIYAIQVMKNAVESILDNATPDNPPIIILQSDHGARNHHVDGELTLPGYPAGYNSSIMYAVYAPGCQDMPLEDGIDPVNTFPLVLNCLFDKDIPLQ